LWGHKAQRPCALLLPSKQTAGYLVRLMMDDRACGFLSAALRHVRDAEHLALPTPAQSLDQTYHLAGFGPECARKASLPRRTYDKAIGHGATEVSEVALRFALAMDPAARRYDLEGWRATYPALAAWGEGARYEATGTRTAQQVDLLLREAREIVDRITAALWMDGMIPERFQW
jgi:hypothetical protein